VSGRLYSVQASVDIWEDITLRAVRTMQEASCIVTLDLKETSDLLGRLGVETPVVQLHDLEQSSRLRAILSALKKGDVAWLQAAVTEWSASECALVHALCEHHVDLVTIPGADPVTTELVMSGLPASRFAFLGTLPLSPQERRSVLQEMRGRHHTIVCRVPAAALDGVLKDIHATLGERRVSYRPEHIPSRHPSSDGKRKSNVHLAIEAEDEVSLWPEEEVQDQIRAMLAAGHTTKIIAQILATESGWPRRQIYQMTTDARDRSNGLR